MRNKVLEQKPETITQTCTTLAETRKRLLDENRPLSALPSTGVRMNMEDKKQMENFISTFQKRLNIRCPNKNNNNNHQKKKKVDHGHQSGQPKKCTHCNKKGYCTIEEE